MKKQFWSMSGVVFLCIFGACLLNLAVMSIVIKIVNLFIELDFFTAVVIRMMVSFLVVSGVPAVISYLVSYRMASFDVKNACGTFCLASLLQLAISLLLKFHPFIGGGTFYLAGIFESGSAFNESADIEYIGIIDYLLAFAVYFAVGLALYILCGKIGEKKRLRDREKLTSPQK